MSTVRHKRGDVRDDGMVFWAYADGCKNNENWVTREKFDEKRAAVNKRANRAYRESLEFREARKALGREQSRAWYRKNRDRALAVRRAYRDLNEDRIADVRLRSLLGISLMQYNAILSSQGGVCAICENPEKIFSKSSGRVRRLAVDHCHKTGVVRGLLCADCNTSLGKMRDDPVLLMKAAKYVANKGVVSVSA